MKLVKSLFLGSAAALVAVGAQAADLPVKKAAPVEYVRICSTYGEGFFYVPGTDSCLRVSGRLRVDVGYNEPLSRANDSIGVRVRGRVNFDHRTATAYGLLRTYVRYEIDRNSGFFFNGVNGTIATSPNLAQGFIQFGGLTAGRVTSFFSNPDLPTTHMGTLRFDDAPDVDLIAYTYSFGNGFSATISAEEALSRRNNTFGATVLGDGFTVLPDGAGGFSAPLVYGGNRTPDVVANVRYVGEWGSIQLSGAVHQVRDAVIAGATVPLPGPFLPAFADTEYGFAIGLQGSFNLPFFGAGDAIWYSLGFADGAFAYINGGQDAPAYGSTLSAGNLVLPVADAVVNGFTGDLKKTTAWSIAGGFTHNWSPFWNSSLFGSYARFDAPGVATTVNFVPGTVGFGTVGGLVDFNEIRVGANTFWTPIPGFQIGVETIYTRIDPRDRVLVPVTDITGAGVAFASSSGEDIWEGRLRIQRDF